MALIANLTTVNNTAPTTPTQTLANAPAGPLLDYAGMVSSALEDAQELKNKLNLIQSVTDGSDPNHATLATAIGLF